jgi:metal-responsive CopG/Arc/MetJ family transcriptional regulator
MAQKPLDPRGGRAPMIGTKLAERDVQRLDELAERRGQTRSGYVRELIRQAITTERSTGPPGGGAAA